MHWQMYQSVWVLRLVGLEVEAPGLLQPSILPWFLAVLDTSSLVPMLVALLEALVLGAFLEDQVCLEVLLVSLGLVSAFLVRQVKYFVGQEPLVLCAPSIMVCPLRLASSSPPLLSATPQPVIQL